MMSIKWNSPNSIIWNIAVQSEERRHSSRSSSQQSLYPIIHIIQQHYSQPGNILLLMFNQENHSQAGRASWLNCKNSARIRRRINPANLFLSCLCLPRPRMSSRKWSRLMKWLVVCTLYLVLIILSQAGQGSHHIWCPTPCYKCYEWGSQHSQPFLCRLRLILHFVRKAMVKTQGFWSTSFENTNIQTKLVTQ